MRLIDADALYRLYSINAKGERIPEKDCDNFLINVSISDIKKDIRDTHTVDAVPVVRCKDCKSWCPDMAKEAKAATKEQVEAWSCFNGICSRFLKRMEPDDYCSYGAKMENIEGEREDV